MLEKVRDWIKKEKLIEAGDAVIAGVSGGADSVCLLLLLAEWQKEFGYSLEVVHVEHGIRGEASLSDATFVERLCREMGIACQVCHVDVPSYAKERHIGMEEAARELRYEALVQAASRRREQVKKIALAHHADDNAETMLFQMVRGSSVRGMAGMRASRRLEHDITLVRPLLCVTRNEIEAYLKERGMTYCTDATNEDTEYSRNRIRHEVMPQLSLINTQAIGHLSQSAKQLAELADYLEQEATDILTASTVETKDAILVKTELVERYPVILQKEVLHQALARLAGSGKDITSVHINMIKELFDKQVGRQVSLPYEIVARRVYEGIYLQKKTDTPTVADEVYEIDLQELKEQSRHGWLVQKLSDGELRMRVREFSGEMGEITKKTYTKLLNYDKIKCNMQFRKRAVGDYFTIDEQGHRKKLKSYFVEEKVPKQERDATWLLTEESHVLWVVGKRISAEYKVDLHTKWLLEIQMSGGKYYED